MAASLGATQDIDVAVDAIVGARHGRPVRRARPADGSGRAGRPRLRPAADRVAVSTHDGKPLARAGRRDDAGFFEGCCPRRRAAASLPPQRRRRLVGLTTPIAFGPVLGPMDDYCSPRARHRQLFEKLGAHLMRARGRRGRAFRRLGAQRAARLGRRRFQRLGRPPPPDAQAHRHRHLGDLHPRASATGAVYKYEIVGADGMLLPLKADPFGFAARAAAGDRLDRRANRRSRMERRRLSAKPRRKAIRARAADVDLRGASRLLAARRRRPLPDLGRARRPADPLRRRHGLHPHRVPADHRAPLDASWGYQPTGLFAPTRRFGDPTASPASSTAPTGPASGCILDWVPGAFPDRRARPRPLRRHRALRARRPAAGLPSRLEHRDLQFRPPRGRQLPARQCAVSGSTASTSTACASMPSPRCSTSTIAQARASGCPTDGGRENLEAVAFLSASTAGLRRASRRA